MRGQSMARANNKVTKQKGKTEVYPFRSMEDINNMIQYWKDKEMWHWYLAFMFGLLMGRRVGDTLAIKWCDIQYENGSYKKEIQSLKEEKTGKQTRPVVSKAMVEAIKLYKEKMNITKSFISYHYNEDILMTTNKEKLLQVDEMYRDEEWNCNYWKAIKSQASAYRKQFKIGAECCGIDYPVSTHSVRKTFGYWSRKLHPYDIDSLEVLQKIFAHSDAKTTLAYIGMTREREETYFNDMGEFIFAIENGKEVSIDNTPVITLKTEALRELITEAYQGGISNDSEVDVLKMCLSKAEQLMIK